MLAHFAASLMNVLQRRARQFKLTAWLERNRRAVGAAITGLSLTGLPSKSYDAAGQERIGD